MQLEDYFDFQRPDDIRVKGTRVGIETILYDFIHRCRTPEEIAQSYPSVSIEQVYATILYYLHYKEAVIAVLDLVRYIQKAQKPLPNWNFVYLIKVRKAIAPIYLIG